jgi:hypothetical protein
VYRQKQLELLKPYTMPVNAWQGQWYHKMFYTFTTVYGVNVAEYLDVEYLQKLVSEELNVAVKKFYGKDFNSEYIAEVQMSPCLGESVHQ